MSQPKTTSTLSDDYREQLASKHAEDNTWGNTGISYYSNVITLQQELNAKSILDYGCGKGTIGQKFREDQAIPGSPYKDVAFYEYDPAIPEKANDTHQADLVLCTDVMEHIEPAFLEGVFADLQHRTLNAIFLVISCVPAVHRLPDGRNAHLIIEHPKWWLDELNKYFDVTFAQVHEGNLFIVARKLGTIKPEDESSDNTESSTSLPVKDQKVSSTNETVRKATALIEEKKYTAARFLLLSIKDTNSVPETLFYLGDIYYESNDLLQAAQYYLEYAQITKSPLAYCKAGISLSKVENYTAALKCLELDVCQHAFMGDEEYREALMLCWIKTFNPERAIALHESRADNTVLDTTQYIDALIMVQKLQKSLDAALEITNKFPDRPETWSVLERVYTALRQFDKAVEASKKAADMDPDSAVYQCNLGLCYLGVARVEDALACFDQATAIDKLMMAPYLNRSTIHRYKNEYGNLKDDLDKALIVDPLSPDIHYGIGVAALKTEQYPKGFAELEWYWHKTKLTSQRMPESMPRWYGEDIHDKTLMFYADQGIGDIIMMMRYVPEILKKYGPKKLIINVNPKMEALFTVSFPEIFENDRTEFFDPTKHTDNTIDCIVAATTLPHIFNTAIDEIPHIDHYLKKEKTLDYKSGTGKEFVIGISWFTKSLDAGYIRSLKLMDFAFLAKYDNIRIIDLQYGDTSAERAEAATHGFNVYHDDTVDSWTAMQPFMDQLAACDLVISIDNTTVHAAGAMGVPCWTLLAQEPFWRWPVHGEATPWYTSLRLFRQTQKDYTELFHRVDTEFKKFLAGDQDTIAPRTYQRFFPVTDESKEKVVLINDTAPTYTWGHYAAMQSVKQTLAEKNYDVEAISTIALNWFPVHKPSLQDFDDWKFLNFWRYKNPTLFYAIEHADHVIFNGDGMMNGLNDTALHILYLAYVSKQFFGKKISIINHSVFPEDKPSLSDPQILAFYHKVYSKLDVCVVRDQLSYDLLRSIDIPCTLGMDASLIWLAGYLDTKPAITPTDTVILSAGPGYTSLHSPLFAKICLYIRDKGLRPVLLKGAEWHGSQEDMTLEKDMQEMVGDIIEVVDAKSVEDFADHLLASHMVISGFPSTCIMAQAAGIPTQPLSTGTNALSFMGISKMSTMPVPVFYEDPAALQKMEQAIRTPKPTKNMIRKWSKLARLNTDAY